MSVCLVFSSACKKLLQKRTLVSCGVSASLRTNIRLLLLLTSGDLRIVTLKLWTNVSARLLPQDKCLDTGDDLFVVDEAIEELLPIFG